MARFLSAFFCLAIAAVIGANADRAWAANLCVSQVSLPGCYGTIGAAVAAAAPGATIVVTQGVYREDVHITQPLSLVAADHAQPVINAIGQPNGVFIDGGIGSGKVTPGANTLTQVTVAGFTIENANFEGVLVVNASFVTLQQNNVTNNDLFLQLPTAESAESCPSMPAFETNESADCGEGIHLVAVDHATVIGNNSYGNSGGMLLSDETGPTHDNLIEGNTVENNLYDCGITLASHGPAAITGSPAPFGVYSNTIAGNISHHNGTGLPGAGAGVGLFAPGPLNQTYGNVVSGNRLTDNGLPGVAIHNHAPTNNINLSNNVIVGNYIAGNGPDGGVETASDQQVPTGISVLGVSPITGLIITQNWIEGESTDIVITNSGASVDVSLNALTGGGYGISNLSNPITTSPPGLVFAAENWWGCQSGPGTSGCSSVSGPNVVSTPFLPQPPQGQTE